MTKESIIQKTVSMLNLLPENKAVEIADFAEYILKKHEENILQNGMEMLIEKSDAFKFLNGDEETYTTADIKEKY